ncbi:MAG: tRNA lysidine(34) synthetase TilS [Acidimicrobiia bacterium]
MADTGELTDPVDAVREAAAVPPGPLVVALSGGADSAVCAWAARDAGSDLRAVFVDHGFAESSALAAAARDIAAYLEIELDEVAVVVPPGPSPEGQARSVRHAALEESLKPGEVLVSGHTADDQAETVLGNVIRGAGAAGLAGIPRRRGPWARPLLSLSRETVRAAADALAIPYMDDPANESIEPRRNQLRHDVLPLLRERFNPELTAALSRTAELAAADDEVLEKRAAAVPLVSTPSVVKVPAAALLTAPIAVASRIARRAIRLARGAYAGDAAEVGAVIAAASGASTTIGGPLQVEREGPWVVLASLPYEAPQPIELAVPGETSFWAGTLIAEVGRPAWRPVGPSVIVLDAAAPLVLRPAVSGDLIDICPGHKKVITVLAEAGVPPRLRQHWPVVEVGGTIAWVVGVRGSTRRRSDAVTLVARLEEQ